MNMIERVARAIYEVSPFRDTAGEYDEQSEIYRRMCRLFAVAAIEAMREPTDGMIEAGVTADYGRSLGERVQNCHYAMIDAALEEPPCPTPK